MKNLTVYLSMLMWGYMASISQGLPQSAAAALAAFSRITWPAVQQPNSAPWFSGGLGKVVAITLHYTFDQSMSYSHIIDYLAKQYAEFNEHKYA